MLTIPAAPQFRLSTPPLIEAVAQVNFPLVGRLASLEGITPLQDALFDLFPYMNQKVTQEVSLMIGPAGPAAPESSTSIIHVFTDDNGWSLSVTVGSASLSVGAGYAGVHDFAVRFRAVCNALYEAAKIRRCDRLGVRYTNLLELDEGTTDWAEWLRPEIVGLAHPSISAGNLVASLTETRLQQEPTGALVDMEGPMQGIVRHGVVPPGSVVTGIPPRPIEKRAFLLDMDTFVATEQGFDGSKLSEQYLTLHGEIENMFHWAITDAGRAQFGYEPVRGEEGAS